MIGTVLIGVAFIAFAVWVSSGWNNLKVYSDGEFDGTVGVVVAFRNEESNLINLLDSLSKQERAVEIILVDDHSTDGSVELIKRYLAGSDLKVRLLSCDSTEQGKKAALKKGIEASSSEILITTDADVAFGPNWSKEMSAPFQDDKIHCVCGKVRITDGNFLQRVLQVENDALMGITGSCVGWGIPSMANGANMSFRKTSFDKVGGYAPEAHVASGDDEFLMHRLAKKFRNGVAFVKSNKAEVFTAAPEKLSLLVQQRKRWASKFKHYEHRPSKVMALVVWILQSLWMIKTVYVAVNGLWLELMVLILLRIAAELIVVTNDRRESMSTWGVLEYLTLFLFFPFYVIYFGNASRFGSYQWKGRSHR